MLIDCHTHAFADKIADRAVEQLINYYHINTTFGGRLADLIAAANTARLDALIMLVAATKPEQLKPANDWILALNSLSQAQLEAQLNMPVYPRIIPFGAFHPDAPGWEAEIARLRSAGIKGIKLHPEFQQIDLADPALSPFWEEVRRDFIIMIHVGDPRVSADNYSTPRKIATLLDKFPGIRIIAAHLGGYNFWEEVLHTLAGREVYLDTSSTLSYINPELLRQIVSKHGTDRLLFGSDYPLKSPAQELELFETKLEWLTSREKDQILGDNCAKLLEI